MPEQNAVPPNVKLTMACFQTKATRHKKQEIIMHNQKKKIVEVVYIYFNTVINMSHKEV